MKHHLLPQSGTDYKANLHCHTTISDGSKTPEEIKQIYLAHGVSIVAYTDHDVLLDHSDLCDDSFLALNGFEVEINEPGKPSFDETKTCHICMIAKDQRNLIQPCWHRSAYLFANAPKYRDQVRFDESKPDFVRSYTGEGISAIMAEMHSSGFYVTYNHPTWSLESYPEYSGYTGMDAMELFNSGCLGGGFDDYNPRVYDDLLRQGKRIFVSGGDDNHGTGPLDTAVAWTVIRSEKLDYPSVIRALESGHVYASTGPEIRELYIEDGKVHVVTSEAARITMSTAYRYAYLCTNIDETPVYEATFPYNPKFGYLRITVTDQKGRIAVSNAYFCDEIPAMA